MPAGRVLILLRLDGCDECILADLLWSQAAIIEPPSATLPIACHRTRTEANKKTEESNKRPSKTQMNHLRIFFINYSPRILLVLLPLWNIGHSNCDAKSLGSKQDDLLYKCIGG